MSDPDPNPVVLVPWDPAWVQRFAACRRELLEACGAWLTQIEHIGSTAIPGLGAKPIIDIMPGLRSSEEGRRCVQPLVALGYEYLGEHGIPGRHYFRRLDACHVHMLAVGCDAWRDHLDFRDHLRAHADAREAYWQLKCRLAQALAHDRAAYSEAKSSFVAEILERARG